jgi:hypothetical protein
MFAIAYTFCVLSSAGAVECQPGYTDPMIGYTSEKQCLDASETLTPLAKPKTGEWWFIRVGCLRRFES